MWTRSLTGLWHAVVDPHAFFSSPAPAIHCVVPVLPLRDATVAAVSAWVIVQGFHVGLNWLLFQSLGLAG
jgi:hypothetical protein